MLKKMKKMTATIKDASTVKDFISGLAEIKESGRFLSFSVFHFFYALELLSKEKIGRNALAEQLAVGEGAIRTILNRLGSAGLVETSKGGNMLTVEGSRVWRELEEVFPAHAPFLRTELTPSKYNYAFLVRQSGYKVGSGIEQRDAAIVAGALCAVVVVFRDGLLHINSICDNLKEPFPSAATYILKRLMPQENDVIVIAGGDTAVKAMQGAFAASWSLLDK